jgi:hypothetical protein
LHSKGEAGYFDPLDTPDFKVACLVWDFTRGGWGSAAMRTSTHRPHPISLGEGAWVSLVVLQPWSPPAFLWCVGVYGEHIDCEV